MNPCENMRNNQLQNWLKAIEDNRKCIQLVKRILWGRPKEKNKDMKAEERGLHHRMQRAVSRFPIHPFLQFSFSLFMYGCARVYVHINVNKPSTRMYTLFMVANVYVRTELLFPPSLSLPLPSLDLLRLFPSRGDLTLFSLVFRWRIARRRPPGNQMAFVQYVETRCRREGVCLSRHFRRTSIAGEGSCKTRIS